jgi:hypothetical protein
MAKLWAFGDSFTFGSGVVCKDPDHFDIYWYGNTYINHAFHSILGEKYNLQVHNKGTEGDSNAGIADAILTNLANIKSGDVVIIGQTVSDREPVIGEYFDGNPWPYTLNHHFCTTPIEELDYYLSDKMKLLWKDACDYWFNVITETIHIREQWHKRIFLKWANYFRSIDVKCLIWDHTLWGLYENLETWSKEGGDKYRVTDGHWSPNGHIGAAFALDYILQNTDIVYLNKEVIEQFNLVKEYKSKEDYVPYALPNLI